MPSRGLVVLVCCLALAGCNGIGGGDARETVTPAPVPSAGAADSPGDASGLAARHATALAATNYTVVVHERVTAGNRTLRVDRNRRTVARNGSAYALSRERNLSAARTALVAPRVAYWYNGSLAVARTWATNETSHHVAANATGPLATPSERGFLADVTAAFGVAGFEVAHGVEGGGVVVRSARLRSPAAAPHAPFVDRVRNASVTIRVTEAGYVGEYRYAYEGSVLGVEGPVRVVREVRFVDVGATTVEPPDWVARAG